METELQINQLKHKQLPLEIDFTVLQDSTLKPVHYLINMKKHYTSKNESHSILADYGTDQFSIRINDQGNYIFVKPLNIFSFKSVTTFQTKFKTRIKKNNETLHQQSFLPNDTDITSDNEDHIYTRILKHESSLTTDKTLHEEFYSTINKPKSTTTQESTSAINVQTNSQPATHCSQLTPFYDTSFFEYKNYFQGFFLPDVYSLDLETL